MFSKTITYTNLKGQEVTQELWFHLNKVEHVELQVSRKGGLQSYMDQIMQAEDLASLVAVFKELVLLAYGEVSEDGERFIKTQELRDRLVQSDAYSALFMELCTDTEAGIKFFNGLVPADVLAEMKKQDGAKKELSDAELLKMSDDDFMTAAGGKNPMNWEPRFLMLATQRKSRGLAAA